MPFIPVSNVGSLGIVKDVPPHELPPEAWSDGRNVRFTDNKVVKMKGSSRVFDPPTIAPYWLMQARSVSEVAWIYAGLAKVYAFFTAGHTDITRASGGDYSATAVGLWNGGILGGIPILNNGVDPPQYWASVDTGTDLANLTNWPASTEAAVVRPFKNFLVALDVTKSGTRSPHLVKWSHPADPGSVPSSWDETDATKDAGENQLADSESGFIFDGRQLRDIFVIYKENSTWGMLFIGGSFVFRFFKILGQSGVLTSNCIGVLGNGARHFVPTSDDVIIHDGQQAQSVLDRRMRRFLSTTMDTTNFNRSFTVANSVDDEMWFCFPESGQTWPNLALVWNWKDGTVSVRELANASFIATGEIVEDTDETWDADTQVWDDDASVWDQLRHRPQEKRLLQADPVNTRLHFLEDTEQRDGSNFLSYVERTGLALVGRDRQGNPKVDFEARKLVRRMRPKMRGGPVEIRVGAQDFIDGPINYSSPVTFTPGVDEYVDACVSGRLIATRFEANADVSWELDGYDLDVELLGVY